LNIGTVKLISGATNAELTGSNLLLPSVSPGSGNYGNIVTPGGTSDKSFTLNNTGPATLNGSVALVQAGSDFTFLDNSGGPFSLAPGGDKIVTVRFAPTSEGSKNATLRVSSDNPDLNPKDVALNGTGATHALTITTPPNGIPNPVASGETANLGVAAQDSLGHDLTYAWTADCPAALVGEGSFNSASLQTPTWTAPQNTTGSQQDCTIQVTVSDGAVPDPKSQSPSYSQGVSSTGHSLSITGGPGGSPNPVVSGGTANLSVAAQDSLSHPLTYAWTADCPAALVGDGSFNSAALQNPTWTAPPNMTGSQQDCTIQVTVSDGAVPDPKSQSPSFAQGVSPEGVGPSEPTVPQVLNLKTFDGSGSEQQTFLPTDSIHVEATYFDPNAACAGVAPVLLQLLFFNLDGQLLVTREDVTSAPIAPGSKYRLLSANLAPGDLVPGAYNLIFLVRDCTNVNIFVSGAYAIRVVTP
jgi:hypothetical protein